MKNKAIVIDNNTETVLFECDIQDLNKAYDYATEMEEYGLDVSVKTPSLPETLARTLGASDEEIETLKQVLQDENDSHNDLNNSCCYDFMDKNEEENQ